MKYKIDDQILIENPSYGALGDDFSFKEIEALNIILNKLEMVLAGNSEMESIYGEMCYRIDVSKELGSIYCYNEFLGKEPTSEIYKMIKEYKNSIISR